MPGPGAYDDRHRTIVETSKSARGTSAMRNKSARMSPVSKDVLMAPGPGAYDGPRRDRTPTCAFGKSGRPEIVRKEEKIKPGPGNYELRD